MKHLAFLIPALLAAAQHAALAADVEPPAEGASAPEVEIDGGAATGGDKPEPLAPEIAGFCFIAGTPPAGLSYTVIRRVRVGKGTYGGVKDILPKFATYSQRLGADAVIQYQGSQRFGFFPWRVVRPVVQGVAIKWSGPPPADCAAATGSTLQQIFDTDRPPAQ